MNAVGQLGWDIVAGLIELVAVIRVVRVPASWWTYRRWSKFAAVGLALLGAITARGIDLPLGAAVVIWHTYELARRRASQPLSPDVPYAQGAPDVRDGEL
jgi:hypothetical protein